MNFLESLPEWVTPVEYARWKRIGMTRAYADINEGVVPSVRHGRLIRIPRAALEEMLRKATDRRRRLSAAK